MSVNVLSTKVLIGDTTFMSPTGDGTDRHFTWSSEPREGLAACSAKEVPSFVSYLRPWVLVWPRELNVWPSLLRSSALPTELILPQAHFSIIKNHTNLGLCSLLPWLSCLLLWNLLTGQWNNLLQLLSQYIHCGVLSLVWLFLKSQITSEITISNATRYPSNWRLLYWCGYDYCENEKVILLSFIFILFYF